MSNRFPTWLKDHLLNYERVESVQQAFSDSTHELWRLENSSSDQKNHFLKVCNNTESPFWQIMQQLFDIELRTEIPHFSDTYASIDEACSLQIPEIIQAQSKNNGDAYILTSELEGDVVEGEVSDEYVRQLARHLAQLHSKSQTTWGRFSNPHLDAQEWNTRLETTLKKSAKKGGGVFKHSDNYLNQAIAASRSLDIECFVPVMPDLRWDQFLQNDGKLSALVDLDAFVFAPREFDFVILEYLLSPNQIKIFSEAYANQHEIPVIDTIRLPLRLLLFYMGILGENDLDKWMNQGALF